LVDVQREDKAYYVPMLESIQQLLNNEAVLEEVYNRILHILVIEFLILERYT
jgi:hypothetical protein